MTQEEKENKLQRLLERQLELEAVMAKSDVHAIKCHKLGLTFAEEYPGEYAEYVDARAEYQENELKIAETEAEEAEAVSIED